MLMQAALFPWKSAENPPASSLGKLPSLNRIALVRDLVQDIVDNGCNLSFKKNDKTYEYDDNEHDLHR